MSDISAVDFDAFFREVNGHSPFRWQRRLFDHVMDGGRWPDWITAPTGTGKSNVVDIHVFLNALDAEEQGPRVPRRLAVVVNRRAIVDSHYQRAADLKATLVAAEPGSVAARVLAALRRLSMDDAEPLVIASIRGGVATQQHWIDDPGACGILSATPEMWGSRLLFNGYGSSRFARPREAGLLARDSVMVLDEAHLSRQILVTARRVAEFQREWEFDVPALQVVATTATPDGHLEGTRVGTADDDLRVEPMLAARLLTPKPITLHTSTNWPGSRKPSTKYAREIADLVEDHLDEADGTGTVGCVVNRPATAIQIASYLRSKYGTEQVILWIGPMRPLDLKQLRAHYPGAFTVSGDPRVRVIVATQTVEVGVDVDFSALVTELAPGTALAQRAGRVNRLGRRDQGPVTVVVPAAEPGSDSGPYSESDLREGYRWLQLLADRPEGISPESLRGNPPPPGLPRRAVWSRLERGEVLALTSTSEEQVVEIGLDRWLRDDLDEDPATVGVVLRQPLPVDDVDALNLLRATPPTADEVYPVVVSTARALLEEVVRACRTHERRAFRIRADELERIEVDGDVEDLIHPGDLLILDSGHRVVKNGQIVIRGGEEDETVWGAAEAVLVGTGSHETADDLVLRQITRSIREATESTSPDDAAVLAAAAEIVRQVIEEFAERPIQIEAPALPEQAAQELPWLVVRVDDQLIDDEDIRQTWAGRGPVALDVHQTAVAKQAGDLGRQVGLSERLTAILEDAGRLHDEGKRHPEFQRILGTPADAVVPLAKSGGMSGALPRKRRRGSVLPRGWRHEQLSSVFAAVDLTDHNRDERELVVRLVGTSHGRGRSDFRHGASDLLARAFSELAETAQELFDHGAWDELVEATERTWGSWDCAYLEALLRAADCMVSKEGS